MKKSFILLLSFICFSAFAQFNTKPKWGKVSQAEIDFLQVPFEPEADAVILYEEGNTRISNTFETTIYRRIKILNERGISAANQVLEYYNYKGLEKISSLKAQTVNIENGETKIYPVDKRSIFDVKKNEYYNDFKFTFPNIKVGSIIEFEYTLYDEKMYFIDAWEFQHEHPTLYSTYKVKNESGLDYISLTIGEKIITELKKRKEKETSDWNLSNVPSFTSLDFLYNPEDMAERIVFQLRGYKKSGSNYAGSGGYSYEDVLASWPALNTEMYDSYKAYRNESFCRDIASTIPNGATEKETLENLYQFFKKNYNWNHFRGISAKQSNREVEKSRIGNSTDLNLMFNVLAGNKGFKSDMILLSSRNNGKLVTSYPYLGQFDYAINLITLSDGSTFLIDAANMENDLGFAPLYHYNHYGLILEPKGDNFIQVRQYVSEYHSLQNYKLKDGSYNLTRTDKINGYFKEKEKDLPEGVDEYNPIKNSLDILTTKNKRVTKDSKTDDFRLIRTQFTTSPISGFINIENPLKNIISRYKLTKPSRERPLEFNFPFYYKTDAIIEIPEGFHAEISNGFDVHIDTNSKEIAYTQNAKVKDNKVFLHIEFYLSKSIFSENYSEIKSLFEKINLNASKNILLKKN